MADPRHILGSLKPGKDGSVPAFNEPKIYNNAPTYHTPTYHTPTYHTPAHLFWCWGSALFSMENSLDTNTTVGAGGSTLQAMKSGRGKWMCTCTLEPGHYSWQSHIQQSHAPNQHHHTCTHYEGIAVMLATTAMHLASGSVSLSGKS